MDTTTAKPRTSQRAPRKWAPGLVAALAVLLLGVPALFLLTRLPPASPEPTAVEIAERYLEARNSYNVERARELVADDFTTSEPPDGYTNLDSMELAFQIHQDWRFEFSQVECRLNTSGPGGDREVVRCEYMWTTELHRITAVPPTQVTSSFAIENDLITGITFMTDDEAWWDQFIGFLTEVDPEFNTLLARSLDLDPVAMQAVRQRLPDYFEQYLNWLDTR